MTPDIYNMELHEKLTWNGLIIIRVPGGWIYIYENGKNIAVFVPFNSEFQQ